MCSLLKVLLLFIQHTYTLKNIIKTEEEKRTLFKNKCIKERERIEEENLNKNFKMWVKIYCIIHLTALALPIALTNENNHEYHPIIYADKEHMINDTVELDCIMHGDNKNLTFYQMISGEKIDLEFVKVNDTTIKHVTNAGNGIKSFVCEDTVTTKKAIKIIQGGIPPSKVEDFNCISYNFEILNCTWIGSDTGLAMEYEACQNTSDLEETKTVKATILNITKRLYSCSWLHKLDANPRYQITDDNFSISLIGSNTLGKYEESFPIDHFSIVKLNPPTNLQSFNESSHETMLSWKIHDHIKNFLDDDLVINIEVDLKSNNFQTVSNKTFVLLKPKTNDVTYTLRELPYAHFTYRVKISMKPMKASDKFWSDTAETFFNTTKEIPKSPDVPAGSYYKTTSGNKRQATLYWKKHSEFEHGGNNFSYYLEVLGNNYTKNYITPLSYIKIDLPLGDVQVPIFAENEKGRSSESKLYIPSASEIVNVTSFTEHNYNNGSHLLTWSCSLEGFDWVERVDNFTIIWCKDTIKNECEDIDYTTVNGTNRKLMIDLPTGNYQFAISANSYNHSTSGLKWTSCATYETSSESDLPKDMADPKKRLKMYFCKTVQIANELQASLLIPYTKTIDQI